MTNPESILSKSIEVTPIPLIKKEQGLFNCTTINCSPEKVFAFCQDAGNVEKILTDLPIHLENFFNLQLIGFDQNASGVYEIIWENKPVAKTSGTLIFNFKSAPFDRGTMLTAEAIFDNFKIKDQEHSTLMKLFLKRMKALLETGEIATTKGQPSGREEILVSEQSKYH